ncbi:MAG: hypothetical protein ABIQ18_30870 [Umezawaea sp.]
MKNSWMRRAGIAFTAAAVGVAISAGSASASDGSVFTSNLSGHATWVENGDTLTVCDEFGDNMGVRGYIYRPNAGDPANGTVLLKGDDPSTTDGCASYSKNIDESIVISIKVCNYQGASITKCQYARLR